MQQDVRQRQAVQLARFTAEPAPRRVSGGVLQQWLYVGEECVAELALEDFRDDDLMDELLRFVVVRGDVSNIGLELKNS